MMITVKNARANNLKNISTQIPLWKITAITGVSGSGKSSLLKEIIGAYGARNFTLISTKTIKESLSMGYNIPVDEIENLPNTFLIDVKNSVFTPISTVSTISGIHELLRNLFVEYGKIQCENCGKIITRDYSKIKNLTVDLKIDDAFKNAVDFIEGKGEIKKVEYFDKNGKVSKDKRKQALATIYFNLDKVSEKIIREFNGKFNCRVYALSKPAKTKYDIIREIECQSCHLTGANLIRSRFSYVTAAGEGGGACENCNGTGEITKVKIDGLFQDTSKGILDGASQFITEKGIKYSAVTEKFIAALYKELNIDIKTPIDKMSEKNLNTVLYGYDKEITFNDRVGGKKTLKFEGVAVYLRQSFLSRKGKTSLEGLFDKETCPKCEGDRFDEKNRRFKFCDKTMSDFMRMTLAELKEWCEKNIEDAPAGSNRYLKKIINETEILNLLSLGHLALYRAGVTLSGGEIQRLRIGALLNSDINGLCYLLDEPSVGLHYSDIENMGNLLRKICSRNNTVIMVEHNKKMLSYADYIVDMGPFGGKRGGNILFSVPFNEVSNYDTPTACELTSKVNENQPITSDIPADFLCFENLNHNNLKNISVKFPRNSYTAVCGVSGSGKSTFVKQEVYSLISVNPSKYGFEQIEYLSQASKNINKRGTILTLLQMGEYIAKLYEKASDKRIKKSCFTPSSTEGKCPICKGSGKFLSEEQEFIGICDNCKGYGFSEKTLSIKVDGLNIYELFSANLEDLADILSDTKIKQASLLAKRLGVGYLSFARPLKSLSKGELQRASLINILSGKEKDRLIILDEPSRGMHPADTDNLIGVLKELAKRQNTILTVEHNPKMIRNADYIIEFGGSGANGGHLLFQGSPKDISDTPTAKMLKDFNLTITPNERSPKDKIEIRSGDLKKAYAPHKVYFESESSGILIDAAKKTRENFLAAAIPNNPMFSKMNKSYVESNLPISFTVDFEERIKYNISISEALAISPLICEQGAFENNSETAKYAFDEKSLTGKCPSCKGTGEIFRVDSDFFIDEDDLSRACKKFLKNSTDYAKFSKIMPKQGADIFKPYAQMTDSERNILIFGAEEEYEIDGKPKRWEGILSYFVKYHNYYPSEEAQKIFDEREKAVCPLCGGKRLKEEYQKFTSFGLNYSEWMTFSAKELSEKIKKYKSEKASHITARLNALKNLNLGSIPISHELSLLDAASAEKIKLLSLFFNRIYDAGIIVKNLPESEVYIKRLLKELSMTNTVWIV